MPSERASLRKLLTKTMLSHTESTELRSTARRGKSKHRKATPAVPLPLGGGREGAFPFRGGFRRGLGGVRGGVYLTRKSQKCRLRRSEEWNVKNQSYYAPPPFVNEELRMKSEEYRLRRSEEWKVKSEKSKLLRSAALCKWRIKNEEWRICYRLVNS